MDPRMAPFDAVMFDVEDDPVLRSFIVLLVELDEQPDAERLRFRVDRMSRIVPQFRRRVVGNALSLAPPRWEVDPNFDLDYHYREVVLPDGSMTDLLAELSRWAEQDFDHARPLWEILYFTGLHGGRAALAVKVHHSITDGVGGIQMGAALVDLAADSEDPQDLPDAPDPDTADWGRRLEEGASFQVRSLAEDAVGLGRGVLGAARSAVGDPMGSLLRTQQLVSSATRVLAPASTPLSPLMADRSLGSYFAELSVDLSDLKAAGKAAGGTLNDAFVAAVLGGMRDYHEEFGEVPAELRVHMPVNLRDDTGGGGGNRWIPARFPLPLNEPDAALRIRQLHPLLAQARNEPALALSDQVYKILMTLPRPVTTRIAGGLMKGTDIVATNVPGPPIPVYMSGARINRFIPFAPKGGAAVNVALMSYNGRAEVGINIDPVAVSDPKRMHELLRRSFDEVLATVDD